MAFRIAQSNPWLAEVEALEERLEAMKLTFLRPLRRNRLNPADVVRATAGCLGKSFPPGKVYERRIRQDWERAFKKHAA